MPILNGLDTTMELTRHAEALKARGYDFVLRYYGNNAAKNLSLGRGARAQGLADGAQAFRMAQESIGQPSYRVGVYGSGLCCGTLVERGIASLSWLSQSSGFAGLRQYADQKR